MLDDSKRRWFHEPGWWSLIVTGVVLVGGGIAAFFGGYVRLREEIATHAQRLVALEVRPSGVDEGFRAKLESQVRELSDKLTQSSRSAQYTDEDRKKLDSAILNCKSIQASVSRLEITDKEFREQLAKFELVLRTLTE